MILILFQPAMRLHTLLVDRSVITLRRYVPDLSFTLASLSTSLPVPYPKRISMRASTCLAEAISIPRLVVHAYLFTSICSDTSATKIEVPLSGLTISIRPQLTFSLVNNNWSDRVHEVSF